MIIRSGAQCAIVMCGLVASALGASHADQRTDSVYALQQQGWIIAEKVARVESHPGIAPYKHLLRMVSVVTYRLQRNNRSITCTIRYDSQHDRQHENCGPQSSNPSD